MREKVKSTQEVIHAKEFANKAHNLQMVGKKLFITHLNDVHRIATQFGILDEDVLVACYLKSVVDETKIPMSQIQYMFGKNVLDIIERVTHDVSSTREENLIKTYAKIKGHEGATLVKLCDMTAIVEQAISEKNHNQLRQLNRDYRKMKECMIVPGIGDLLWNHLDYLFED